MKTLYMLAALCLPAGAATMASANARTGQNNPGDICNTSSSGAPVNCTSMLGAGITSANADGAAAVGSVSTHASAGNNPGLQAGASSTALFEQMFVASGGTGSGILIGRYALILTDAVDNNAQAGTSATIVQGNASFHTSVSITELVNQEQDVQSNFTFGVPFDVSLLLSSFASTPRVDFNVGATSGSIKLLGFTDTQGNVIQVVAAPEPGLFPIIALLAGPAIYFVRRRGRSGITV